MKYWKIFVKLLRGEGVEMNNRNRITKKMKWYLPLADVFFALYGKEKMAFLDSSLINKLGRYSILGLKPYLTFEKKEGEFYKNGVLQTNHTFESCLKKYLGEHMDKNEFDIPIVSGAIGYLSYDYGREKMGITSQQSKECQIAEAVLVFYDVIIVEDCLKKEIYISARGNTGDSSQQLKYIEWMILNKEKICQCKNEKKEDIQICEEKIQFNFEKDEYKNSIEKMIQYMKEGDIYIANMTQQLKIKSKKNPVDVFEILRKNNPAPFGGFLDYGTYQIISASPERFLQVKNQKVQTRPIKGTRKRGKSLKEDELLFRELEQSEKDHSELLMIVDLERNDLNRICIPGSVKVTELFSIETYATVFHLISNIEGVMKDEYDIVDVLQATFPGGSVTGAPKYRAMEIIDELEHGKRGIYTGAMGYMTLDGACDFNIVIRTVVHKEGYYYLGVGGGITVESDLEFEYEETLQKAKAILEALK